MLCLVQKSKAYLIQTKFLLNTGSLLDLYLDPVFFHDIALCYIDIPKVTEKENGKEKIKIKRERKESEYKIKEFHYFNNLFNYF